MSNPFFEKSREIANDFLQSIVFIDDKAYSKITEDDPNHDFDAQKVSMAFAKEKKVCGVYQPKTKEDIENFISIVKKADVIILDWKIILSENEIDDLDADDDDDPRGIHTLNILKNITQDITINKESLKLIVIYTGETDLNEITNQILDELQVINPNLEKESCVVFSNNIKILIRAKSSVEDDEVDNKFNHLVGLNDKIVKYKDLPNFVLDEFTLMTSGLLSNFALLSLTILRENSSKILGLFSKEMDSAYLGHKAIIPKQEDAEDLLIELFGDSVKDLLYYSQVNENLRNDFIESWIDDKIIEENFEFSNHKFKRAHSTLKSILKSDDVVIKNRFNSILSDIKPELKNHLLQNPTKIFTNNTDIKQVTDYDKNFSKLTHHKSLFIPKNSKPKLTLGTLIKSSKYDIYYICIQQKCDSVRIPKDSERKFLFIPLSVSDDKFDILTPEGIKLKKCKDSFSIRTIKFVCPDESGVIVAVKNDKKYIFKQKYTNPEDEQFEWILDLKDLHSQRIIIDYTSQLSRVGLDESEWHRRYLS